MTIIWDLLSGLVPHIWGYIAAAGAALVGIAGVYIKGRSDAKAKAKTNAMKEELAAHDRINKADTGAGLSDDQRADRLRDFARRNGK